MKVTDISVTYGMVISNGNYGSERVDITVGGQLEPDERFEQQAHILAVWARDMCLARLRQAHSPVVRRAVMPPPAVDPKADLGESDDSPF